MHHSNCKVPNKQASVIQHGGHERCYVGGSGESYKHRASLVYTPSLFSSLFSNVEKSMVPIDGNIFDVMIMSGSSGKSNTWTK